jgi:hypothetical protein
MSPSAYSNSGDQKSASNGQTSMQMPQYMHSEKSIAKRSRTLRCLGRPPSGAGIVSLCESIKMHQSGHSRAQSMQEVQFSSISAMTPRLRGGRAGLTSGYCCVTDLRSMWRRVIDNPFTSPTPGIRPMFNIMAHLGADVNEGVGCPQVFHSYPQTEG